MRDGDASLNPVRGLTELSSVIRGPIDARTVVNAGLGRILGGVPGAATGCAVISKVSKTEQSGGISAILGVSRGGRKRAFFIRI